MLHTGHATQTDPAADLPTMHTGLPLQDHVAQPMALGNGLVPSGPDQGNGEAGLQTRKKRRSRRKSRVSNGMEDGMDDGMDAAQE